MIRACRFAGRFGFEIETQVVMAIKNHKELIAKVSKERILDEFKKASSYGSKAFRKFIIYMQATGLLDEVIVGGLSRDFRQVMSALQDCNYDDFNLHLCIVLFGCGDTVKDDLKLSNENWEVIKFVNDNYVYYSLLDQLTRTRAYELCSHKHFKILRECYLAFEKKCSLQDVMVPYILEYKDAYEQQSIISDEMLKTVKPSKAFGFMKKEMLESHLHKFEMDKKLRSEEEIRQWVKEWLETDMIYG
jgi:tRNA nucleotidyltransferase/poly(A) polymerase